MRDMGRRSREGEGEEEERAVAASRVVREEQGGRMEKEKRKEKGKGKEKERREEDKHFGRSFFRVLLTPQSLERMKIPSSFNQCLQNQPTGMVSLADRSGNTWSAELTSDSEGFCFVHGWKQFVRDNFIQCGQFVVFTYDKRSHFSVVVFDPSGIDKMPSHFTHLSKKLIIKTESDEMGIDNAAITSEKMAPLPKDNNRTAGKIAIDVDCHMEDRVLLKKSNEANVSGSAKRKRSRASLGKSKATSISHNSTKDEDMSCSKSPKAPFLMRFMSGEVARRGKCMSRGQRQLRVISQRRPVTEAEKDHALQRAKEFKSKNPFVLQIMMESYVYVGFFMNIPCEFVRECLPRTSKRITLWDPQGKAWAVNYVYYSDRSVGSFSGGWGKFAVGNNLEKFDVCVFELVQKDNIKVHIYRVVPEITPPKLQADKR
ncbi:B3 domain-containing protein Os11g0197600-like isoform X2 [Oryza brachyantha]|uniref:B3 domain-containing protein Os11g0197600-like isoform X2 n=1 Tax=Oryza brachyantha TaxID=4533 RepID=UPI001ADBF5AF|nr:B3 domain-containing protein Os11g0197600-like isoform X2 [Oryza brachyantha]